MTSELQQHQAATTTDPGAHGREATAGVASAGPVSGGADLGRRSFFRQFAGDMFQAAATVAGAAGALQRTSAELASTLIVPAPTADVGDFDQVTGNRVRPAEFRTAFRLESESLILVDQRKLPDAVIEYDCRTAADVAYAIRERIVRGTPALGQVAGLAIALAAERMRDAAPPTRRAALLGAAYGLQNARPSSITVRRTVDRMLAVYEAMGDSAAGAAASEDGAAIATALRVEADAIVRETTEAHRRIAEHGLAELPAPAERPLRVLTIGNSGLLACGSPGTALGVVTAAAAAGRDLRVLVCESRPLLQGARLTAWELDRAGIPYTVIADAAASTRLARGLVDVVLVAADRVAANGDFVGTLGTYPLAVLAARHGVPLVACAPLVAFDPDAPGGDDLPIDERLAGELALPGPTGLPAAYLGSVDPVPVGDVTPSDLVAAIVTEEGVLREPFGPALAAAWESAARGGAATAS